MCTLVKENSTPLSTKKTAFESEMRINVKTYREVGNHIICFLSKASRSSTDSLVDRVSNCGVSGDYAIFIAKYPDRTVGIRGIDNHEMTSASLASAVRVTSTTSIEVSIIMHQHECHSKNNTIHLSAQIEFFKQKK